MSEHSVPTIFESQLTPEAKARLSKTVREWRDRLLDDLHAVAEGRYRLGVPINSAGLDERARIERLRLEAWLDGQVASRRLKDESDTAARRRHLDAAVKLAASTLLNRLMVIKLLEQEGAEGEPGRITPMVVTGGWNSPGYRDFREFAPELARDDDTEGYATLLSLLFEELALDLPGLFGPVDLVDLLPPSASALRGLVEALDHPELATAWRDDTTLGWVYQYWNDPEREALDAKLHGRRKLERHEIASKTQMFTERYMVEWLLHNTLGQMWLAMCRKHGYTPEVEARGVLDALEAARERWRAGREAGTIAADELPEVPGGSLGQRWKYWVRQPMPADAVTRAPDRVADLRILDPACGSGHFLVIAFDLLHELYLEEARHRGEGVDHAAIVERILEHNLHGIDLDPRAVQIAAAALRLKAWRVCPEARPRQLQLVATNLGLGGLADDDPAREELRRAVRAETGLSETLADDLLEILAGADHLGSLLRVGAAVRSKIQEHVDAHRDEMDSRRQLKMWEENEAIEPLEPDVDALMTSLLARLEAFLARHSGGDDLGLRLHGEQLAAGLRFLRLLREDTYDLVIGNPPYQGTSKLADAAYIKKNYKRGKADLYAAFLERGLELARPGGVSALLTMRNWMFTSKFTMLRKHLLKNYDLRMIGDVDRGAFDEVPNEILAAAMSIFRNAPPAAQKSIAMQPTPLNDKSYDRQRTSRKRAAILGQLGKFEFEASQFDKIPNDPMVYWWTKKDYNFYTSAPVLSSIAKVAQGISTAFDDRFIMRAWEVAHTEHPSAETDLELNSFHSRHLVPLIKGVDKNPKRWFEPLSHLIRWSPAALEIRLKKGAAFRNQDTHFHLGVAYSAIGKSFHARTHCYRSVCHNKGSSIFFADVQEIVCLANSKVARDVIESLNPGFGFEVGDVARLPVFKISSASKIFLQLQRIFEEHESHRETSVEYREPGPSCWRYAQDWAQRAVDRPEGEPLPAWEPEYDAEPPVDHLSHAVGVALGRFGAGGEGFLDEAPIDALPHGLLFLNALDPNDSLEHPACEPLRRAWHSHGAAVDPKRDLRIWLRERFFQGDHRRRYEDRPIYLPLSSEKRTFVAWMSIHRADEHTLAALITDHLRPALTVIDGELDDLRQARDQGDRQAQAQRARREDLLVAGRDELITFIDTVRQIAESGPPPAEKDDPPRQADAPFRLDLDDGVMIHSAALWPLLEPQGWKKPRQWWSELCRAEGKKDYDWSHLAERYFPHRVAEKCAEDPSLAVAHHRFWRLHPAKAYAWELRLQDEIGDDFTLDEPDSDLHRAHFLEHHPEEAAEIRAAEEKRRERKRKKAAKEEIEARRPG